LFLKELRDFFVFFWKTPLKEKSIVFYSEHEGYFPNFEGVIKNLTVNQNKTICYITSDFKDPIFFTSNAKIKPFYINKLLILFMQIVKCDVLVMTLTDLNQFHLKRSFNPVCYIYIFHSLVSTTMMYRLGAFDHYDIILCAGKHQKKEIKLHEKQKMLNNKKLVETGYYRLERIIDSYSNYLSQLNGLKNKKTTILIAPSWGNKNILETCGVELVNVLLASNYNVIVRPHPETVKRNQGLIKALENNFAKNPYFTLERSVFSDSSIIEADILICDCSGIAIEYAFGTNRPVIFIDVPLKIQNQNYKDLGMEPLEVSIREKIGIIMKPDQLTKIPETISILLKNKKNYKKQIEDLRNEYVFSIGDSSEIAAQEILNNIDRNI
tara:strand:+ start:13753 stop:14895 length:1143 start_codon:yes stop_codon:yes gene_type:complete